MLTTMADEKHSDIAEAFMGRLPPVTARAVLKNPAPKRRSMEREVETWKRRCLVADLVLRGVSQPSNILRELGLGPEMAKMIDKDLAAIKEAWREQAIRGEDAESNATKLCLQFEKIAEEAWKAWEASKKPHKVTKKKRDGTTEVREFVGQGDPVYLRVVSDQLREIVKLKGIGESRPVAPIERNTIVVSEDYFAKLHAKANALREQRGLLPVLSEVVQPAGPEAPTKNGAHAQP